MNTQQKIITAMYGVAVAAIVTPALIQSAQNIKLNKLRIKGEKERQDLVTAATEAHLRVEQDLLDRKFNKIINEED